MDENKRVGQESVGGAASRGRGGPRADLPARLVKYIEQEYDFTPEPPETYKDWVDLHELVDTMPLGLFLLLHARSDMIPLDDSLLPGRLGPDTLRSWCKGGADVEYLGEESPYRDGTEALDFVVTPLGPRSGKPQSRRKFLVRVFPPV